LPATTERMLLFLRVL